MVEKREIAFFENVSFERVTKHENRIWFNTGVVTISRKRTYNFQGTGSILDRPEIGPLNMHEALTMLQTELFEASKGVVLLSADEFESGIVRILTNPTVPTGQSAEFWLNRATEITMEILKSYAI
ncbi:MAG: hypothetical protein Q4B29_00205 [Candidatus Saccharibacteria bacterium]|nr:hypothetical protein [Candidatus Saccharibacteria bacterium]